eukprot:4345762-Prymnesium_polylepis.1
MSSTRVSTGLKAHARVVWNEYASQSPASSPSPEREASIHCCKGTPTNLSDSKAATPPADLS